MSFWPRDSEATLILLALQAKDCKFYVKELFNLTLTSKGTIYISFQELWIENPNVTKEGYIFSSHNIKKILKSLGLKATTIFTSS